MVWWFVENGIKCNSHNLIHFPDISKDSIGKKGRSQRRNLPVSSNRIQLKTSNLLHFPSTFPVKIRVSLRFILFTINWIRSHGLFFTSHENIYKMIFYVDIWFTDRFFFFYSASLSVYHKSFGDFHHFNNNNQFIRRDFFHGNSKIRNSNIFKWQPILLLNEWEFMNSKEEKKE